MDRVIIIIFYTIYTYHDGRVGATINDRDYEQKQKENNNIIVVILREECRAADYRAKTRR